MNTGVKQQLLMEFPEWHQQPLRLNLKEIKDPQAVIDHFFISYSLSDIRVCLKQLLSDALVTSNCAADHFATYEDVERIIEACFILYSANGKKKKHVRPKQ